MESKTVTRSLSSEGTSKFQEIVFAISLIVAALCSASCAQTNSQSARDQQPASESKLVLVPNAVDFSNVVLGQKNSQTIRMSNEDTVSIQVKSIQVGGSAFSISGAKLPLTLAPQGNSTFNVEFAPKTTGAVSTTVTIESSLSEPVSFSVKGTGTNTKPKLQTNPVSVNFGNLTVKGNAVETVVVSNPGNANITVDRVAISGSGFGLSQLPSHFTLTPQQEESFLISFHPTAKGAFKGSLQFFSKALSTPLTLALTGSGVDAGSSPSHSGHTVKLSWDASPGNIRGYYVYRGDVSGGPYTRLSPTLVPTLDYADVEVASGHEYFYVVTALNHGNHESNYSHEIGVAIPSP